MYAYKVFTTTIMGILMISLLWAGLKADKSGKIVTLIMFAVQALGIIAIWG